MPRLLDKRVIGGSDDVINRTYDAAPPGYVLKVSDNGRTLDLGPPVGFTGSQGVQGPTGPAGSTTPGPTGPVGVVVGAPAKREVLMEYLAGVSTFVAPPNVTSFAFIAVGAGGGTGYRNFVIDDPGDGSPTVIGTEAVSGGTGGHAMGTLRCVPGESYQIVVGLGGQNAGGDNLVSTNGGDTTIEGQSVGGFKSVLVIAKGGGRGQSDVEFGQGVFDPQPGAAGSIEFSPGENVGRSAPRMYGSPYPAGGSPTPVFYGQPVSTPGSSAYSGIVQLRYFVDA
jgi:hypothetical protein